MKTVISIVGSLVLLLTAIDCAFSQSLIATWDMISAEDTSTGCVFRYCFSADSTVIVVHAGIPSDTAHFSTFEIPPFAVRGIDLGRNGVVGWRGIYQVSSDSSIFQIEGYWYTGLPDASTPNSFSTPSAYARVSGSMIGTWDLVSGPDTTSGRVIRYYFYSDSTVAVHAGIPTDTADCYTFSIPSSGARGIDLGKNGSIGWRGIYQVSSDSLVLQIQGYWYTGLPIAPTLTSFSNASTYSRVVTSINRNKVEIPEDFSLLQNYPNPFNPTTTINYQLPTNSVVALKVYDVLGREMATLVNERQSVGSHSVRFDANNLPSGVYFYRLDAGTYHDTKKLVLLK